MTFRVKSKGSVKIMNTARSMYVEGLIQYLRLTYCRLRSALHKTPAEGPRNFALHPSDSKSHRASKSENGASESISGYGSDQ